MANTIISIGDRFTRLVVIAHHKDKRNRPDHICQCDCGRITYASTYDLLNERKRSCGCLRKELVQKRFSTHSMTGTPEHRAWKGMKVRCYNTHNINYKYYGARGITICQGFMDFPTFLRIAGTRPSPELSNDRINNNGHYSCGECTQCLEQNWPLNVRWATKTEQSQNRQNSANITLHGETHCIAEWARRLNITRRMIQSRLKRGWSSEDALTTPSCRQSI